MVMLTGNVPVRIPEIEKGSLTPFVQPFMRKMNATFMTELQHHLTKKKIDVPEAAV